MINVTIGESKTQSEKPFPKLMICINSGNYNGRIVYMISERIGIILKKSESDYLEDGYYSSEWNMPFFTDYNEPITLQNA